MMCVKMENCLTRGDSSELVSVLRSEGLSSITLTRLDQLVTKDLCGSGFSRVLVVLKSLEVLSENRDDLKMLVNNGLTVKVLLWFEAVHDLLTSDLQKNSNPLLILTEEFYDYLLLLGQSSSLPVSQLSVILLQLARFTLEPEIHFPLRLEAIRTFNSILESLSREQRRLIQNDQNQSQILSRMAAAVLTVGGESSPSAAIIMSRLEVVDLDYELQVSLSEALCRLTPRKDREQRANQWFSSNDISSAFCDIRDKDFEVDCRRFLNFVNGYHGDQRRVYTFPCRRAFLDSMELFPPKDDKLDKFWIDFNLSSGCVSFFIDEPQGFLWGSIHLLKQEVDHYTVELKADGCTGAQTVLSVRLNNPIMHHNSRGQTVQLNFDCEHHRELEEAAGRVFKMTSPPLKHSGGSVQVSPSANHSTRSYSRKKPQSKSHLKILPLSSPSSEEESCVMKTSERKLESAESLFDHVQHSTPSYNSGVPVRAELQISLGEMGESRGGSSPLTKEVFGPDRKRDSGYLSDQSEGLLAHKRRVGPQPEGEEPDSPLTVLCNTHLASEGSPEGLEPPEEEEEEAGLCDEPVMEPKSDLTCGITAAFNTFKTELEQHFTSCWQNAEAEVLQSLKECQQHVTSLLTAVHQHRLALLHTFQISVSHQLNRLEENSTSLNSINSQILGFFQAEMTRLGLFCEEHLQRLKSLESEASRTEHLSGQ